MNLKDINIPEGMKVTEYEHLPYDRYTTRQLVRISPDWKYYFNKLKDAYKKNISERVTDYPDDARVAYQSIGASDPNAQYTFYIDPTTHNTRVQYLDYIIPSK